MIFWFIQIGIRNYIKGIGHFFETFSVGSVNGTDHPKIYTFSSKIRFQTAKCINMPVSAYFLLLA